MAENTQVINIESKYKDKGLAELKKVLAGTQLAMNNLSKAGKESSDSFIKLQARTIALNSKIGSLTKPIAAVNTEMTKLNTSGIPKMRDSMGSIADKIPFLSLGLAGVAGALVNFSIDAFKAGASFQELRSNFIGSAADLELFRKATAGTVTDGGLIQLSNYASDLGVSLNDQALLFSLAEDAADKYGGTVEDNFQRVINATDGSAKGLRAIGIGVKEYNKELEKLLPNNVKNIDDLDAETQQQIRLEAIIKAKGITIEDVKKKQASNADVIANLSHLYETFTVNVGLAMNENVKLGDSMTDLTGKTETLGKSFGNVMADILSEASKTFSQTKKEIEGISNVIENMLSFIRIIDSLDLEGKYNFLMNGGLSMINANKKQSVNEGGDFQEEIIRDPITGQIMNQRQPPPEVKTTTRKKSSSSSNSGSNKLKDKVEKTALELLVEAVNDIQNDKKFQNFIFDNLKVSSEIGTVDPLNGGGIDLVNKLLEKSSIEEITSSFNLDETLGTAEDISTQIQSLFGLLGAGTDTFIGKMLGFFNTITSILQAFSLVKSIIGLFGTLVGGGAGKALSMPSGSGGGNVYLGLDLNTMQVYKQGRQQYMQRQNQIRIN